MNTNPVGFLTQALWLVVLLSAPPIIAASVCGIIVAIFQSATQLQEQTLQYGVKFIAIVLTILVMSGVMGGLLLHFADQVFSGFPILAKS